MYIVFKATTTKQFQSPPAENSRPPRGCNRAWKIWIQVKYPYVIRKLRTFIPVESKLINFRHRLSCIWITIKVKILVGSLQAYVDFTSGQGESRQMLQRLMYLYIIVHKSDLSLGISFLVISHGIILWWDVSLCLHVILNILIFVAKATRKPWLSLCGRTSKGEETNKKWGKKRMGEYAL